MLKRLRLYLRYWFRPLRCECGKKCLSVQGLGRHRATHKREAISLEQEMLSKKGAA